MSSSYWLKITHSVNHLSYHWIWFSTLILYFVGIFMVHDTKYKINQMRFKSSKLKFRKSLQHQQTTFYIISDRLLTSIDPVIKNHLNLFRNKEIIVFLSFANRFNNGIMNRTHFLHRLEIYSHYFYSWCCSIGWKAFRRFTDFVDGTPNTSSIQRQRRWTWRENTKWFFFLFKKFKF